MIWPLSLSCEVLIRAGYKPSDFTLVGGFNPTPLKNMSSSVGIMTFPISGKTYYSQLLFPRYGWDFIGKHKRIMFLTTNQYLLGIGSWKTTFPT
jgi:hypothetical protein